MPPRLRLTGLLAAVVVLGVLVAACSAGPVPPLGEAAVSASRPGTEDGSGRIAVLAPGTCWTDDKVGADPQEVARLSSSSGVPYLTAARAVADRPSFTRPRSCTDDHAVEVFNVLRLPTLEAKLRDYGRLLRVQSPLYGAVARAVAQGCMTGPLARAAARSRLPGAVMAPVLPSGASVGWAPAAPAQWAAGQRVFACTLTWPHPRPWRYDAVFTQAFPVSQRTCIDNSSLAFVDCARRHDRERIAVIEARDAVAAGAFPGPRAIRRGPEGRRLDVPDAAWRRLDAACTAYLHAISRTTRLSGVANVDVDQWPRPDGSFPIWCDADTRPDQEPLVTTGSVYDR